MTSQRALFSDNARLSQWEIIDTMLKYWICAQEVPDGVKYTFSDSSMSALSKKFKMAIGSTGIPSKILVSSL